MTGASAHLLQSLPQAQRTTVLRSLFSTEGDDIGAQHGKCLSVDNSSTADGAGLSQQPCSGSPAQAFTLTR